VRPLEGRPFSAVLVRGHAVAAGPAGAATTGARAEYRGRAPHDQPGRARSCFAGTSPGRDTARMSCSAIWRPWSRTSWEIVVRSKYSAMGWSSKPTRECRPYPKAHAPQCRQGAEGHLIGFGEDGRGQPAAAE